MNSSTNRSTNELFFQIVALLLAVIIVHTIFVTVVRPNAESTIRQHAEMAAAGEDYVVPRSFFIVIKDLEQEACFILMFWALAIMGYKTRTSIRENKMLQKPLISIAEGSRVLPEDAAQLARPLQALPEVERSYLLPRALQTALTRFQVTASVQFATEAVTNVCETENDRLDSELSMVRYITWAIPSIGFIGTVRGIGAALGQAHEAMQGNIAGVTSSLGVAFNSTFIALLISMVVMFFMFQLQLIQERLVLDSQAHCENNLLRFLKAPKATQS
ncbi:MAG: MotA/TolQ/ExbB proton channel family protein [Porticoccaceae bacterium]|jgi:biopolymer transport protein ExbB/TolQ|nr:MotA/TolQ/ExbB proton channel family protein [Porticoccaceae bacterium]MBT5577196.1 MotA/TolQ/ExbB proton channel family protein [Porticoccaceae bacterium]MBT7374780.1 MotA/TolQ/ExbB proton channel family protein [Porticoccaceae bacterium]